MLQWKCTEYRDGGWSVSCERLTSTECYMASVRSKYSYNASGLNLRTKWHIRFTTGMWTETCFAGRKPNEHSGVAVLFRLCVYKTVSISSWRCCYAVTLATCAVRPNSSFSSRPLKTRRSLSIVPKTVWSGFYPIFYLFTVRLLLLSTSCGRS